MGYVDKNLMPGEVIAYKGRLHWIRYAWPVCWILVGLIVGGGGGGLMLFTGVVLGVLAMLDVISSEFVVTNRRVFLKQGIIRRSSTELLLGKIESLQVEQGLLGRMLNFGSIVPGGSGGTKQVFHKIALPLVFRQRVNEQIEGPSPRPTVSVPAEA